MHVREISQFELVLVYNNPKKIPTTDHRCNKPGCESVLVLDGNMKNARQVCSCNDVGELKFAGMDGSIVVGKWLLNAAFLKC